MFNNGLQSVNLSHVVSKPHWRILCTNSFKESRVFSNNQFLMLHAPLQSFINAACYMFIFCKQD